MITKKKNLSPARRFIQGLRGGPLTFGELISSVRENNEITQIALARKMGITRQNLCAIEKGRRTVSLKIAAKFAKVMGYSKESFVAIALEDELRHAGLRYAVELHAA